MVQKKRQPVQILCRVWNPELALTPSFNFINQPRSSFSEWETYYSVDGNAKTLRVANQCGWKTHFLLQPPYLHNTVSYSNNFYVKQQQFFQSSALALRFVKLPSPFLLATALLQATALILCGHHLWFWVLKLHTLCEMRHAAWVGGRFVCVHSLQHACTLTLSAIQCRYMHIQLACMQQIHHIS